MEKGKFEMGRLIRIVVAKKYKIINMLITENMYQQSDRSYLLELPLRDLEELLVRRGLRRKNH